MSGITLADIYKREHDSQLFLAERAWETIKFHITLSLTLITVTLGLFGLINSLGEPEIIRTVLIGALVLFPYIMFRIVSIGEENFQRECNRMYEAIAVLMKIEEKFDLRGELSEKNHFFREPRCTPLRYDEKWETTEKFVDDMMEGTRDNFYTNMRRIFPIFRIVSYILISIISISFWSHWGLLSPSILYSF